MLLAGSNADWDPICGSDFEILPAHPQAAGSDLEREGVHRTWGRSSGTSAVCVKDAAVTGAEELCLVGLPVDGTSEVRTDRRQDCDVLLAASPDPNRVPEAR